MVPTLVVAGLIGLACAALFGYVALVLGRRDVLPADRLAHTAFRTWWICVAAYTATAAIMALLAAANAATVLRFQILGHLGFLALCLGLAGLLYFLIYLYTGGRRAAYLVLALYGGVYLWLAYLSTQGAASGIRTTTWSASLDYATPPPAAFVWTFTLVLLLPIILGAIAYNMLGFKVPDRTTKYRVGVVSWSLIVWFALPLPFLAANQFATDTWGIVSLVAGLAAGLAIIAAYQPPRWVRQRWGVRSLAKEHPAP